MSVTDNFTNSDGTTLPAHSANWVEPSSGALYNNLVIKTNAVRGAISAVAVYTGTTFANDQYAQATVVNTTASGELLVLVRTGATGSLTGYGAGAMPGVAGHSRYVIWDFTENNAVATHGSQTIQIGDIVKLEATGTTIRLLVNGSEILSQADATDGSGYPGLRISDTGATDPMWDNWEAGDVGGGATTRNITTMRVPNMLIG